MAKSKYSPEIVEKICAAIALSGSDKAGFEAGQISKDTFYRWLQEFKDFSDKVNEARSEWKSACPETLARQARKALSDYLFGRMERIVTTVERGTSLKTGEPYEREIIQRVPVGVPKWAIERVLGRDLNELEALKCLVEAGWFPRWFVEVTIDEIDGVKRSLRQIFEGILPDGDRGSKPAGLTEETAARIRAEILGIKPSDIASLPAEVDQRSVADQSS